MKKALFLCLAALSALSAMSTLLAQPIEIPSWVDQEIQKVGQRIQEWQGSDPIVLFPVITDVHSGGRDTYRHVAYLNHAAKSLPFDFIADLGDIGLDVPATKELEVAMPFLQRHAELHHQFPGISINLVGNHDHNRNGGQGNAFNDRELGEFFNVPSLRKSTSLRQLTLAENGTYGFVDIPARKVRVFFLNTSDRQDPQNYYTVSPRQMDFLVYHMRFTEPGWTVLVLSHYCMWKDLGAWNSDSVRGAHMDTLLQIFQDFNAAAKGESEGVRWDFTGNVDCRMAAYITGDSHFDVTERENGILVAISQGFGGVSPKDVPRWASRTDFNPAQQTLVDIVAVKPQARELKIFRMGAGGAEKDRTFSW